MVPRSRRKIEAMTVDRSASQAEDGKSSTPFIVESGVSFHKAADLGRKSSPHTYNFAKIIAIYRSAVHALGCAKAEPRERSDFMPR